MAFMRAFAAILVLCALGTGSFVFGYPLLYPTYVVRYRLTVNVSTADQLRSGSSVIEVKVKTQPRVLDNPPWAFAVAGDAPFVDIGNGRNLVAPLAPGPSKGIGAVNMLFKAFGIPFLVENAPALKNVSGERRLEPRDWPAFVTFRDDNDPLSVDPVDPSALQAVFGAGARIESVTLAITQDPVTHSLQNSLPWLASDLDLQVVVALAKRNFAKRSFTRNDP